MLFKLINMGTCILSHFDMINMGTGFHIESHYMQDLTITMQVSRVRFLKGSVSDRHDCVVIGGCMSEIIHLTHCMLVFKAQF